MKKIELCVETLKDEMKPFYAYRKSDIQDLLGSCNERYARRVLTALKKEEPVVSLSSIGGYVRLGKVEECDMNKEERVMLLFTINHQIAEYYSRIKSFNETLNQLEKYKVELEKTIRIKYPSLGDCERIINLIKEN